MPPKGPENTWAEQGREAEIRDAYARRDKAGKRALYSWQSPAELLARDQMFLRLAGLLRHLGFRDLFEQRILDLGCGRGELLRRLREWGAAPRNLHGVDLLPDRIAEARELEPSIHFTVGSGWELPFEDNQMDAVFATVVLSSVTDPTGRLDLAREMARVLAPGGALLVYDFRVSHPRNPDTVGISGKELGRLFGGLDLVERHTLTLAPPIARRLPIRSGALVLTLEALMPFLRTHGLFAFTKPIPEGRNAG